MTRRPGISCEADLGQLMVVANHEAKALVLGGMQPDESYGYTALHRELLLDPQGEDPVGVGHIGNAMDYCRYSLVPAGCVERVPDDTEQYAITGLGEREGKALVGHVLALSLDAGDISLRSLYGMARTGNGKRSRPPLDRVRIFRELLGSDELHASDIQAALGSSPNTAKDNLRWLDREGIVDYEGIDSRDAGNRLTYNLPKGLELKDSAGKIRKVVTETLRELTADDDRECTLNELIDILKKRHPEGGFETRNRRAGVIGMMNELAEEGLITKNDLGRRSAVELRDSARPIVARSVAIADGMLSGDGDFLDEGKAQLRVILGDQERIRTLIAKAFRASPEANGLPLSERISLVSAYLAKRPGTVSEITDELEVHGMTERSVGDTLGTMRKRELARATTVPDRRANLWLPVSGELAA